MIEIKNARISSTVLGYEGHGILTSLINLDFGGVAQAFGGFELDRWSADAEGRVPDALCGAFVAAVLAVGGVEKWEDLPGRPCRAYRSHSGINALGHYLEDKWAFWKDGTFVVTQFADMPTRP